MTPAAKEERRYWPEPVIGLGVGGFLLPFLLFLYCLKVLRDPGGPLFWPAIAIPSGAIGFAIGFGINLYRHRKK